MPAIMTPTITRRSVFHLHRTLYFVLTSTLLPFNKAEEINRKLKEKSVLSQTKASFNEVQAFLVHLAAVDLLKLPSEIVWISQ